jgi:hypothetical protein
MDKIILLKNEFCSPITEDRSTGKFIVCETTWNKIKHMSGMKDKNPALNKCKNCLKIEEIMSK